MIHKIQKNNPYATLSLGKVTAPKTPANEPNATPRRGTALRVKMYASAAHG